MSYERSLMKTRLCHMSQKAGMARQAFFIFLGQKRRLKHFSVSIQFPKTSSPTPMVMVATSHPQVTPHSLESPQAQGKAGDRTKSRNPQGKGPDVCSGLSCPGRPPGRSRHARPLRAASGEQPPTQSNGHPSLEPCGQQILLESLGLLCTNRVC